MIVIFAVINEVNMELNAKIYGQGEPIVILHGLFGMLDNWLTIGKQLANHYTVILIDQRNHGKSPHTEVMNYNLMSEDVARFLESNWIYDATVIGHSMGGKTAMQLALNHPDLLSRLVVIDIAPKAYPSGHDQIFEALFAVNIDQIDARQEVDHVLSEYIYDPGVRLFLMKNLKRKKSGGYEWKMNLPTIHKHYNDILGDLDYSLHSQIEVPTLLVSGDQSNYIVPDDHGLIRDVFQDVQMKSLNAGHWVHADQPNELLNTLFTFIGGK